MSTHLGEALHTDLFSAREQFTEERWSHFITVRRFADEEIVPVIGPYWERSEIPVAAGPPPARARHRGRGRHMQTLTVDRAIIGMRAFI